MGYVLLGALGFLPFALKEIADYDPKLLKRISKNSVISNGTVYYIGGIALIVVGTVMQIGTIDSIGFCIAAAVFLLLQLYVLFGCFSNDDAYKSKGNQTVYDKGPYALCRHPGLWCFVGAYIFLCLGTRLPWHTAALYIALDLALVIAEDKLFFPKTIEGYDTYKTTTPFLFPTVKSIKRMFK